MYRITVSVTTPVFPTEDDDRVRAAVRNLFPEISLEQMHGEFRGEGHALDQLLDRIREQAIVDSARDVFMENTQGESFSFALKKQAAFEGVVNFAVGTPDELGEIHVTVTVDDPDIETFISDIVPRTTGEQ